MPRKAEKEEFRSVTA